MINSKKKLPFCVLAQRSYAINLLWPFITYHHFKHGGNEKEEENTLGRQCTCPFFGPIGFKFACPWAHKMHVIMGPT